MVAFGPPGKNGFNPGNGTKLERIHFARGKSINVFGQASMLAVQKPLWDLISEEHEIRVLFDYFGDPSDSMYV